MEEAVLAARAALAPLCGPAPADPDRLGHLHRTVLELDQALSPIRSVFAAPLVRRGAIMPPRRGARHGAFAQSATTLVRAGRHSRLSAVCGKLESTADGRLTSGQPDSAPRRPCSRTASSTSSPGSIPPCPRSSSCPVVVAGVWLGADRRLRRSGRLALLVAAGLLIWTLTEYWLHRLVFHWEPDHPIGSRLHFIIHGVHHDHPNDRLRLVMPPGRERPAGGPLPVALHADLRDARRVPDLLRVHPRLPHLRLHALSRAPPHTAAPSSASGCASSTCATTSRTTGSDTASRPRCGTSSSAPCPARRAS